MKTCFSVSVLLVFCLIFCLHNPAEVFGQESAILLAQQEQESSAAEDEEFEEDEDFEDEEEEVQLVADPLYSFNRQMWEFNDGLYFVLLKPVARGYGAVVPQEIRMSIKNMFYNIRFPVRFINCLLQGKGLKAIEEFSSFFLNTTVGFVGMVNVASIYENLDPSPEDFGQTFAVWGSGEGFYIMWPFLGPSTARDSVGLIGDTVTDPIFWMTYKSPFWVPIAIRAGEVVNKTSLTIGDYEALKQAALDPYVAIRNAFIQNRNKLIAE